ncbi:MAG: sulfate permease [Ignavibacteria bacterium]|nr:sulfate permease [Ignavibacteria bacterium]
MLPELFSTFKNYTKEKFLKDLSAGIIVGIVALPLAIAFGIASGVSPEKGLITAIIGGFIVSAFGGSKVQIGGPTGAFIVIVYGIIQTYGLTGLTIATVMAGVLLLIMGFARFGSVIKFIPYPVTVGFTSGIALTIFSTQIKDIFGLKIENVPSEFFEKWQVYFHYLSSINYYSLTISVFSLLTMIFWPKITHKIPGSLVAIIISTVIVYYFKLPVETIGSRFGEISSSIPEPHMIDINFNTIRNLLQPAIAIALLAAIESLLSAVVADGMIGSKHKSDTELIAQGAANIIVPLFGGIPVTGAIARTATNIKNGGRTPVSGIVHAMTLLLVMLFFGSLAGLIPMASLGAVLVIVSYNMSEWKTFRAILKSPMSDVAVLLTTFGLTVVFDLVIAIEVGMVLAVFLFMRRMAAVTNVGVITRELKDSEEQIIDPMAIDKKSIPEGVEVFEINGPFFFGAAEKFKEAMQDIEFPPKVRIIRMRSVPAIDATGINILKDVYKDSQKHKIHLILSGVHAQPLFALQKDGLLDLIGEDNVCGNIDLALERSRTVLGLDNEKK